MTQAYCPYCGKEITVRGQAHCPHCGADIIYIWKLLNSHLQPPPLVRPALSKPQPFDWIAPMLIIILGLVIFALSLYLLLPWLMSLVSGFNPGGMLVVKGMLIFIPAWTSASSVSWRINR